MAAKKRQTLGKIMRERERAEKRALKLEKKEARKAAQAAAEEAGLPWPPPEGQEHLYPTAPRSEETETSPN